jgi:hypothetical protein
MVIQSRKAWTERLWLIPWKGGPVRDYTTSPRLFTGRPKGASKAIAENLIHFLVRYGIPMRSFTRNTEISGWAVRQAKAGVRSLSPGQELLIKATMKRILTGRLWLRRVNSRRQDLQWVDPPYTPKCPTGSLHCPGAILPGTCPRHWRECGLFNKNWEPIEEIHKAHGS